ncbi:serine/threonine-protein kinase [Streptomyces yerevanensis]|uniref:serine/threonine-protein kinase n=1 Tax=Streptomyces yerevanensis TaxID=66378 RepID=UPI00068B3EC3|nr:serine/threonine-protein kinase [Streptomyces yerevanensis]
MDQLGPDDPARIGPYCLLSRLGAGGMGRVYLAREADGGDDAATVAVKLVRTDIADVDNKEAFRRRFAREVAAARRVSGEWTARVLDADTEADVPWVATEYVPGPTLRAVVRGDFGPLPSASAHVLANRLALALDAIHTADLVHRDLKPSNILLTVDGPRVIDFGIARTVDSSLDSTITRTGALVGTPEFMSPEQVRGERVTAASDVFSLGSVLVYAATGRSPFLQGESSGVHTLMFRIAYEEPELTGVPEAIAELVRHCLSKDPDERPTIEEILDHTHLAPSGAWLPADLLVRLDRVAARPLPEAPLQGVPEPSEIPFELEFPDFPEDLFLEDREPASRRDPLDAPEAGITPPSIRRTPPTRSALAKRRLTAALVAVASVLSVATGAWVTASAVRGLSGAGAEALSGVPEAHPQMSGDAILDRGGAWWASAALSGSNGDKPFMLHLTLRGRGGTEYVAATEDVVCTGSFGEIHPTEVNLELASPTRRVILPEGLSEDRCPQLEPLYLKGLEHTAPVMDGTSWRYDTHEEAEMVLYPATPAGSPIPAEFVGTRQTKGWTVTVRAGTIGSAIVTGTGDFSGRHCEWSAVALGPSPFTQPEYKHLGTTIAYFDSTQSDPGCKAPQGQPAFAPAETPPAV